MSLETLDRTLWSFDEALRHVETVTIARREAEAAKLPRKPEPANAPWGTPHDPTFAWKQEAEAELLVALRDGDLLARGRYTEERTGWAYGAGRSGFGLHSGYHTSIRPEQWREGSFSLRALTARDWEFIDIRMPRFMVKAIWRAAPVESAAPDPSLSDTPYTTPYLALMQVAIREFGLTDSNQGKKELILEWFLAQHVEDEPISNKLADAMATLIRLPSAQRGGAKRMVGQDLRQVG